MILKQDDNKFLLLVSFLVLLTRLPFLFAGYGSEEDAWGLILVARNINLLGIYEVSRMPGHPVQEYLLSLIWNRPAWMLNFLTALVSSIGIYYFMKTLVKLHIHNAVIYGLALAFVPVFFINSTNVMDYNWTLCLVLIAFYLTVTGRYLWAGVIIGIACGFRVTAGAMVIPFAIWHYLNYKSIKIILLSGMLTLVTAIICFLPAWNIYGSSFFTYYEYFPYPPMLKNIYKGTIGAWGLVGAAAIAVAGSIVIRRWRMISKHQKKSIFPVVLVCISTLLLYSYSFIKIPQKSAFVLPMVPFIILLISLFLNKKEGLIFCLAMILSCFFFGINLDDPLRGSKVSELSFKTKAGTTSVVFDLLSGPVIADYTKRKQKITYAITVTETMRQATEKTVIIAGWWQNELNYFSLKKKNTLVSYLYYADEQELRDSISAGNKIYFLPEQDYYNDLRFKKKFTRTIAEPF